MAPIIPTRRPWLTPLRLAVATALVALLSAFLLTGQEGWYAIV